jgi:hypothetical protein
MESNDPPKKPLQMKPGESSWAAMARTLSANPDSPDSLRIMSAISQAVASRQRAVDQVVEALQAQIHHAGELENAAVAAAVQHWEREFGEPMPADVLADLARDANERIERERRRPPSMESILEGGRPSGTDTGYALGVHLEGLDGTWHRLWGIVALAHSFGNDLAADEGVAKVREQFQGLLGRAMSTAEWNALVAHAVNHADTVMQPRVGK